MIPRASLVVLLATALVAPPASAKSARKVAAAAAIARRIVVDRLSPGEAAKEVFALKISLKTTAQFCTVFARLGHDAHLSERTTNWAELAALALEARYPDRTLYDRLSEAARPQATPEQKQAARALAEKEAARKKTPPPPPPPVMGTLRVEVLKADNKDLMRALVDEIRAASGLWGVESYALSEQAAAEERVLELIVIARAEGAFRLAVRAKSLVAPHITVRLSSHAAIVDYNVFLTSEKSTLHRFHVTMRASDPAEAARDANALLLGLDTSAPLPGAGASVFAGNAMREKILEIAGDPRVARIEIVGGTR